MSLSPNSTSTYERTFAMGSISNCFQSVSRSPGRTTFGPWQNGCAETDEQRAAEANDGSIKTGGPNSESNLGFSPPARRKKIHQAHHPPRPDVYRRDLTSGASSTLRHYKHRGTPEGADTARQKLAGLATVSIVGTAAFVVLIAALHFLSPEFDPIQRRTSEYAVGPFGYLMTLAFVVLSVGTWALVSGLHRDLSEPARSRLGLALLGLFGTGLLVAAVFPTDLEGAPQTLAGTVHTINGALTFLSAVTGANLVSRRLKHDEKWQPTHRLASVLALIMIPVFLATGAAAARETGGGIAQRILLVTLAAWFVVIAMRLRSNAALAVAAEG